MVNIYKYAGTHSYTIITSKQWVVTRPKLIHAPHNCNSVINKHTGSLLLIKAYACHPIDAACVWVT